MVDRQFSRLSATLTLMIVSPKYIFPNFFGEGNSFEFFWHIIYKSVGAGLYN
jgi:hypothetical protein